MINAKFLFGLFLNVESLAARLEWKSFFCDGKASAKKD